MGVTKIGRRNANYWIEAVAEGGEDYYIKPGEAPVRWPISLAGALGPAGEVDRTSDIAALAGHDPPQAESLHRLDRTAAGEGAGVGGVWLDQTVDRPSTGSPLAKAICED